MERSKIQKGITLVALIVTIIVLLIIAVVAIRAVQGDGIIAHAKNARAQYEEKAAEENALLLNLTDYITGTLGNNSGEDNGDEEPTQTEVILNKLNGRVFEATYNSSEPFPFTGEIHQYSFKDNKKISKIELNPPVEENSVGVWPGLQETMAQCYYSTGNGIAALTVSVTKDGNILFDKTYTECNIKGETVIKFTFEDGTIDTDNFSLNLTWTPCLPKGTYILVEEEDEKTKQKKRKKKKIEDITYEDNLVVWNFDEGCFDTVKPLWLMKKKETTKYNILKFSDGSELKTVNQHRIFNKELGKFTYPMTEETPIGTTTFTEEGKEVQLISKEIKEEYVEYYNIISYYHMNVFANGILTSCRLNNLYPIKDMRFVKEDRKLISKDVYSDIPEEYYEGLRLAEQPTEINRGNDEVHANSIVGYIKNLIAMKK